MVNYHHSETFSVYIKAELLLFWFITIVTCFSCCAWQVLWSRQPLLGFQEALGFFCCLQCFLIKQDQWTQPLLRCLHPWPLQWPCRTAFINTAFCSSFEHWCRAHLLPGEAGQPDQKQFIYDILMLTVGRSRCFESSKEMNAYLVFFVCKLLYSFLFVCSNIWRTHFCSEDIQYLLVFNCSNLYWCARREWSLYNIL